MRGRSHARALGSLAVALTIGSVLLTLPSASAVVPCMSVTCPSDIVKDTDPGICAAVVTYSVTSVGSCTIIQTAGLPSGSEFPVGTTTNCFRDQFNASITCCFKVVVHDAVPPVITCPGKVIQQTGPAIVNYPQATVIDNCPDIGVTCLPLSGTVFPSGQTNVSCTAFDGNSSASCAFDVVLVGAPGAPAAGPFGLLALAVVLGALGVWTARRRFG